MSGMATEAAGAAAAAAGAVAAAAGSSTGALEIELRRVADKIASVEAEQKLVKGKMERVEDALGSERAYYGMTGEQLIRHLQEGLMKKEEGLMKKEEQLRDEKAKLMDRQQVTGEEIVVA